MASRRSTKSSGSTRARSAARAARQAESPRSEPSSQRVALLAAEAGLEKKAGAIEIIDVQGKVDYADYLVLMSGQNERHVAAIADAVEALLSKNGLPPISVEGRPVANWVLIDFFDVVVHVFQREARAVYDLDGLWMDARRVPMPGEPPEPP